MIIVSVACGNLAKGPGGIAESAIRMSNPPLPGCATAFISNMKFPNNGGMNGVVLSKNINRSFPERAAVAFDKFGLNDGVVITPEIIFSVVLERGSDNLIL